MTNVKGEPHINIQAVWKAIVVSFMATTVTTYGEYKNSREVGV
jgi:hypothetical protein